MSVTLDHAFVRALLPGRPADGHKGTFGHVCLFAGSQRYAGAAKLAALGAARSGAGLVTVAVPPAAALAVSAALLEPIVAALPSQDGAHFDETSLAGAADLLHGKNVMILGPGLGVTPGTAAFVAHVLGNEHPRAVVDADALNVLAGQGADLLAGTVCTPHPGELGRLVGADAADIQRNRRVYATHFASERWTVVVLKGRETIVATPEDGDFLCPLGNAGMATGGSGDVLAGLIGGLLAQGLSPKDAAIAGVYVHALAGDHAARRWGQRAMLAGDMLTCLGDAWRELEGVPS